MDYKWCAVPQCKSSSIKTPKKLFIKVPNKIEMRRKWLQKAGRDPSLISNKTYIWFCESHFDMKNDMENFMEYKLMGSVKRIRMKPDCLPSIFNCEQDQTKMVLKKHRKTKETGGITENKQATGTTLTPQHEKSGKRPRRISTGRIVRRKDRNKVKNTHQRQQQEQQPSTTDWYPDKYYQSHTIFVPSLEHKIIKTGSTIESHVYIKEENVHSEIQIKTEQYDENDSMCLICGSLFGNLQELSEHKELHSIKCTNSVNKANLDSDCLHPDQIKSECPT